MKLEVGMYVRYEYEKNVYIGKIKFISEVMCGLNETLQIDIDNCMEEILKKDILKASYNIIDLIETKDLVEIEYFSPRFEERITRLFEVDYKYGKIIHFGNRHCDLHIHNGNWSNEDEELEPIIKSIVTREQFEAMQYKVVEE